MREDDLFPTAIGMLAEILRKNSEYSLDRQAKDKLFVTCRGQALLLVATLKAKVIPARVRSGFASYPRTNNLYCDHWISEYYDFKSKRFVLVDADCCCNSNIDFDIYDIPRNKFMMAAEAWIHFRNNSFDFSKFNHAYYKNDLKGLIENLTTALFYDFHCLMNDEIIYLHYPKYLSEKDFDLNESDLLELDMLDN